MRSLGPPLGSNSEHKQVEFMLKITSAKKFIFLEHGGGYGDPRVGIS